MYLKYDLEKLTDTVTDFYRLTGINLAMVDTDFRILVINMAFHNGFCKMIQSTEEGRRRCEVSDGALLCRCRECGHAVTHQCHAGLSDMAVPLFEQGIPAGYFLFGQINELREEPLPFDAVYERVRDLGLDREALEREYGCVRFLTREQVESATRLVTMLTRYIWMEDMILSQADSRFEKLVEYVNGHLRESLSVDLLCRTFHMPKNLLYRCFHEKYQCTVNGYILCQRMERAKALLRTTEDSVSSVGALVGIEDGNYFCRMFKREVGCSPLQYRKKCLAGRKENATC